MKELNTHQNYYMPPVPFSRDEWYYVLDSDGDLYEAEELARDGRPVRGTHLYLIHYPDGRMVQPVPAREMAALGAPVCDGDVIAFPEVDFGARTISICRYHTLDGTLSREYVLSLDEVRDCYNLLLHGSPLFLSRQPNDGSFEILWPQRKTFAVAPRETLNLRDGEKLYFSTWYEDPDYREETIVRSFADGRVLESFPGDVHLMPDGQLWHLF